MQTAIDVHDCSGNRSVHVLVQFACLCWRALRCTSSALVSRGDVGTPPSPSHLNSGGAASPHFLSPSRQQRRNTLSTSPTYACTHFDFNCHKRFDFSAIAHHPATSVTHPHLWMSKLIAQLYQACQSHRTCVEVELLHRPAVISPSCHLRNSSQDVSKRGRGRKLMEGLT